MVLPLIPIAIALAVVMAVIGFLAIVDYLAIGAAIVSALYAYIYLDENTKWGASASIVLSVLAGFLLYKMFMGITLFAPLAVLLFAAPAVVKAYLSKYIKKIIK